MGLVEIVYGVLFSPAATFNNLSKNKPWLIGIIIYLIVMSFNMIINRGISLANPIKEVIPIPAGLVSTGAMIGIILSFIMLFIMAGLLSLLAELFFSNARPNAKGLLTCLSLASLPGILGAPLQYTATVIGLSNLAVFISFIVAIWLIVLQVIALRESLELSTSQAVVLYIIPLLTIVLLVIAITTALVFTAPFYK